MLTVRIPDTDIELELAVDRTARTDPSLDFTPVEGTDYSFRVESFEDGLVIGGSSFALAIVEIRRGEERFIRWVFDEPSLVRDLELDETSGSHGGERELDAGIDMAWRPGHRPPHPPQTPHGLATV